MTASLALSMIVRDAARFLPDCLTSVRGLVNEMVIADTGSLDDTIAIAQGAGARVFRVPWNDDFSAARNAALAEVRSEWVLSLDADERLDDQAASKIPALLANSATAGYQVKIRNYVGSLNDRLWDQPAIPNKSAWSAGRKYPAYVEHYNVRLFRHITAISFLGRVHESVGPTVERSGLSLGRADFIIHHFGLALDQDSQAAKNELYRRLGHRKIQEMPDSALAHFELGLVEMDNFHDFIRAQALFERARTLDSKFGMAWFFEALACTKLARYSEALTRLDEAELRGYRSALLAETRGDALYNLGNFANARASYSSALRGEPDSASLQSKLGLATIRSGDQNRGLRGLRLATQRMPEAPDLHDRLILALVWVGDIRSAALAADAKLGAVACPKASDYLRAASLWSKTEDWQTAARIVHHALQEHPENTSLRLAAQEIATKTQESAAGAPFPFW